jgi:4-amino-4-deoxy-L-arabinose transferase-like glycosyltransferase
MNLPTDRSRWISGSLAVVVVALVVRLVAVLVWGNAELRGTGDQTSYVALAQNVRMHHAFSFGRPQHWIDESILDAPGPYEPTAARAPLYPLMIAALWQEDAPPLLEVRLAQALLGTLVALMVYAIALKAFGFGAALVAGLAVALGPLTALMTALFLSETLFTFLFTASLWFWTRKNGAMAGIMLGAATLTRAVSLPVVGIVLLLGLLMKSNRALHLQVALVALATIALWTIRNAITQHAFVPVASVG